MGGQRDGRGGELVPTACPKWTGRRAACGRP
jgi:hypothetical protein